MIDYKCLRRYNTTDERLKELLTATCPENIKDLPQDQQDRINRDVEMRKKIEERIQGRLQDSITFNLTNYQMLSAVDLAWDSQPVNKSTVPMMLYAQGKLDMGRCATSLNQAGFGKYVKKDDKGQPVDIDLPKFFDVPINLVRSIITRRHAAQVNKYSNFWPHFKYESRSTSLVGKLRGDVMSQVSDIIADAYDYKHHEAQVVRDMFLYAHSIDFIRAAWECEKQERVKPTPEGLEVPEDQIQTEVVITKEGLGWVNPHPSRTFWDNAHPLSSLNSDTGCEWVGYWDVWRYKEVRDNTAFFNRDGIRYTTAVTSIFDTYNQYFNQYFTYINAPRSNSSEDLTSANDRANNIGIYTANDGDTSILVSVFFWKLVPKDWGIGDYPHPVWIRFITASDSSIVYAEICPSSPCAVASYNEHDNRQISISMAHELLSFQDQLTNLESYLLLVMQANNIRILVVNNDVAEPHHVKAFREQLKGTGAYTGTTVLEVSASKLQELGLSPDSVVKFVETKSTALDVIFRAIAQLLSMVERMMALSPQEQGQPAPREISATESNLIAGTTESVYGYISDAVDEYRAARKRILYESYIARGNQEFRVPVINRYSRTVIAAAGFEVAEGEYDHTNRANRTNEPQRVTVIGTKEALEHDYIFTSRDGAERPVNTQSAAVLVQLLQSVIGIPGVLNAIGPERLFEMVNEVFRQSGAGSDLRLEVQEGESDKFFPDESQMAKMEQLLTQVVGATEQNAKSISQIQQALGIGQPPAGGMQQAA